MCRPDDFPPYDDAGAPCPPDCTNVRAHDHDPDLVAQPQGMFRSLDAAEEQAFRAWARANWQPGQYVNPVWHPVVRDECQRMTAEKMGRSKGDDEMTTIPLTTTDVDGREWLTTDLIHRLEEDAAEVRQQLADLQDAFQMLMVNIRTLPGGQGLWDRVDAYPGIRMDRDMGAGQGADGWIREVSTFLEVLEAAEVDYADLDAESGRYMTIGGITPRGEPRDD